MPLRPTFAFAMLALLACLCVAPWQSAPAAETVRSPTQQPGPEAWILPPPWPGKGRCLFEMVRREAEWSQTRRLVRGIGYWPLLLNNGHSDNEIRELFVKLKAWRLGFALEVPVLKGDHWCGDSLPLQAKGAFDLLQQYAKRFRSLGMGELDWISFDEPIYAARHIVPMPSDNSELAAPESVALAIKDPAVTRRLYYGIAQTVSFIAMLRQAYPGSRLGDVEPYPALKYDEIVGAVEGIQKGSAARDSGFGLSPPGRGLGLDGAHGLGLLGRGEANRRHVPRQADRFQSDLLGRRPAAPGSSRPGRQDGLAVRRAAPKPRLCAGRWKAR